jgi:hypothetical protein
MIRVLFDLAVFYSVNVTLVSIFVSVVVNNFGSLRSLKEEKEKDIRDVCFICSQDRSIFEKTLEGFEHHVEKDHYLWKYLYYLYFLKTSDETEFGGIDFHVEKMIEGQQVFWVPISRSLATNQLQEKENEVKDRFDGLFAKLNDLIDTNEKVLAKTIQSKLKEN